MFHKRPSFFIFWILSFLVHSFVLSGFFWGQKKNSEKMTIHLTKGSSVTLFNRAILLQKGLGKTQSTQTESQTSEGSSVNDREIDTFRNSLSYPELALEQGLEDDCTFRVTVAENGLVEKLVVIAPCKYNVFDSQIRSQLRVWKFNISRGKDLVLPIRFRIHARE